VFHFASYIGRRFHQHIETNAHVLETSYSQGPLAARRWHSRDCLRTDCREAAVTKQTDSAFHKTVLQTSV